MSWKSVGGGGKATDKTEYIYDGMEIVDARIFFGKFCENREEGVLLSEIAGTKSGLGYIAWLYNGFDSATDELRAACDYVYKMYR